MNGESGDSADHNGNGSGGGDRNGYDIGDRSSDIGDGSSGIGDGTDDVPKIHIRFSRTKIVVHNCFGSSLRTKKRTNLHKPPTILSIDESHNFVVPNDTEKHPSVRESSDHLFLSPRKSLEIIDHHHDRDDQENDEDDGFLIERRTGPPIFCAVYFKLKKLQPEASPSSTSHYYSLVRSAIGLLNYHHLLLHDPKMTLNSVEAELQVSQRESPQSLYHRVQKGPKKVRAGSMAFLQTTSKKCPLSYNPTLVFGLDPSKLSSTLNSSQLKALSFCL